MSNQTAPPVTYRAVLQNRNYFWMWIGQAISQIGDALSVVAIPLLVYQITGSALDLAISFMITTLPWILIGPFAGVLVDRADRRTVLIATDLIRVLFMLIIFFTSNIYLIYVLLFLSQCMATIFSPARSAVIPELVPREMYVKTIGLSYTTFQISQMIGPFLAAGLVALAGGARTIILLDSFTFLAAVLATLMIRFPDSARRSAARSAASSAGRSNGIVTILSQMKEGAMTILRTPLLRFATMISLLRYLARTVLLMGVLLYLKDGLGMSATESDSLYTLVVSAAAVGTVLGTLLIGWKERSWERRLVIVGGVMLQGLCYVGVLLHPSAWWLIALFLLSGLFEAGAITPVSALFAEGTPNEVRGRVYSVINAILYAFSLLTYSVAGPVVETAGPVALIALGGLFMLIAAPLIAWSTGAYRLLKPDVPQGHTHSA
ncbi:MFS transporter [Tumebacillus sp. DT12]|uniref:MFS transporter n=1 Tax=Tumebacillus lacus TaxID=2995335 RepID=A0ABT3WZJ0_9BACL|nr:MFS transporter [Tumebacillus lacus]MCX7570075.1 MFS transporter [Tumebacillus lacus]